MPVPSPTSITLGQVSRRVRRPGVTLTEALHGRGVELPEHSHREAALGLVLDGGFEERVGDDRFRCRPLSLLYKPPDVPHSNRYGPGGARTILVALDGERFERLSRLLPPTGSRAILEEGALAARALSLCGADGDGSADLLPDWEELFARVLDRRGEAWGPEARRPAWLRRVEDLVDERFAEPLGLSALGEAARVHPVHLARVYRRHHGCSIGEALRRRRIEHSVERLRSGQVNLAELALECGFADQSHFTRAFRREVGTSPDRFRRRALVLLGGRGSGSGSA